MARKEKGAALSKKDESAIASTGLDELADALDGVELDVDGLEETGNEDFQIAAKVFNFPGTDANGEEVPKTAFFDTIDETAQKEIDAVFLTLHKTNEWREFDQAEGKTKIRCRSSDRITGKMDDGRERSCKGCPDAQWTTTEAGDRRRRCGPVYNLVGIETANQRPFVLRCKRTSLQPCKQYLNRWFLGRRVVNGERQNYPLFAFKTRVSLKLIEGKSKFAVPVFDRGDLLPGKDIRDLAEQAKFYREKVMPALDTLSESDGDEVTEGPGRGSETYQAADFTDDDGAIDVQGENLF